MRNPKHLKDKRSRKPNVNYQKCTQIFATRNTEKVPADNRQALWAFRCTRLKLLSILRRHEKIASILKDVKHRIEPIQFLLSTAEERSLLNANRMMPKSGPNRMQLCGLKCLKLPTKIRCWLRLHLEELNSMDLLGEHSYAQELKLSAKKQMQQEHDEHEAWKVFLNDWHNQDDIRQCNSEWQEKGTNQVDQANHLDDVKQDDWKKLLSGFSNLDINQKIDLLAESNAKREAPEGIGLAKTHDARENGDWENILNDLNDWCDQTEPDEILIDADASVLGNNISNKS